MCLQVFAVPAELGKVSARRLAELSGLAVTKLHKPFKNALWFSKEPGCSCSLMAEDADWNEPTWRLEDDVLEPLAVALELIAKEAGGFTFQAIWAGEEPSSEAHLPLKDVLREVRENRIRNKLVYRVGRVAAA